MIYTFSFYEVDGRNFLEREEFESDIKDIHKAWVDCYEQAEDYAVWLLDVWDCEKIRVVDDSDPEEFMFVEPPEPPSDYDMWMDAGCRKYHEMKDEGEL